MGQDADRFSEPVLCPLPSVRCLVLGAQCLAVPGAPPPPSCGGPRLAGECRERLIAGNWADYTVIVDVSNQYAAARLLYGEISE